MVENLQPTIYNGRKYTHRPKGGNIKVIKVQIYINVVEEKYCCRVTVVQNVYVLSFFVDSKY